MDRLICFQDSTSSGETNGLNRGGRIGMRIRLFTTGLTFFPRAGAVADRLKDGIELGSIDEAAPLLLLSLG